MADPETPEEEPPKKGSKKPVIIGLVLALISGGGGFYAVQSGMLFGGDSHQAEVSDGHTDPDKHDKDDHGAMSAQGIDDVAFVPVDPLIISLGGSHGHLRFRAQLEVKSSYTDEVTKLMPRVVDVLNNYLRALAVEDLSDGTSLTRLRAQMLRRVQVVTGAGRVEDLLIMEFVLN